MKAKRKVVKVRDGMPVWGGFVGGKLDKWRGAAYGYDDAPLLCAVFTNRAEAEARYTDVRRLEIRQLPTPRKAKR